MANLTAASAAEQDGANVMKVDPLPAEAQGHTLTE